MQRLGVVEAVQTRRYLWKRHLPSWESDHGVAVSDTGLTGGTCLPDLERVRHDPVDLEAIGAKRVPAPTTVGDFVRRVTAEAPLLAWPDAINEVQQRGGARPPVTFRQRAGIDVEGTHVTTDGACTEEGTLSHEGIWGDAPLIVSWANTREVLSLVNRPGHVVSHDGAVAGLDRAITLVTTTWHETWLRGDTDVRLTAEFDRWDAEGGRFVCGLEAMPTLNHLAAGRPPEAWQVLERPPASTGNTRPRTRPKRRNAERVRQRAFRHIQWEWEEVGAFPYRPTTCQQTSRVVGLRTHLRITQGDGRPGHADPVRLVHDPRPGDDAAPGRGLSS